MWPRSDRRRESAQGSPPDSHFYSVYGLTVESALELPELIPTRCRQPNVQICFGQVPETLSDPIGRADWCMASRSEFIFSAEGVARYHVAGGGRITIERRVGPKSAAPASDIRLWLLGTAFGALLHQRGLLPLHVSAVKSPNGVWAFAGDSGEGKSTLAGFLHGRFGWDLVSDDVSVIDLQGDRPLIRSGPRKLKLWEDALRHLGYDGRSAVRDLSSNQKFQLYLPTHAVCQAERLTALVLLESTSDGLSPSLEIVRGREAFDVCLSAVYRPYMARLFKCTAKELVELAALANCIQIYRFRRPRSLGDFESNLTPLLNQIRTNETSEISS